jgi:AAA family ATP:ADP antiporter
MAEILGHYRSYQLLAQLSAGDRVTDPAVTRAKASMDEDLERIFRLMKLLFPAHDFHSAYVGLQSANAGVRANALEFLEHTLPARLRTLILPLIDGEVSVVARMKIANRIIGVTADTPEEAVAALVHGHDEVSS